MHSVENIISLDLAFTIINTGMNSKITMDILLKKIAYSKYFLQKYVIATEITSVLTSH